MSVSSVAAWLRGTRVPRLEHRYILGVIAEREGFMAPFPFSASSVRLRALRQPRSPGGLSGAGGL